MGDLCDLKHLVKEEGSGASVKVEGLSKAALIKSLSPRVMLSNHLLPKGTKMKVNLEDQGRPKVSFSFVQTKKNLQSPFFIPASPDKSAAEPHAASSTSDKAGKSTDGKTEQKQMQSVPASIPETPQTSVSTATKQKTDLAKMHFKKQILSVSVPEEKPTSLVPEELHASELQVLQKSTSKSEAEFPAPQPQNVLSICPSENAHIEASETRATPSIKKPAASSGKDGESSSSTEQDNNVYKRKTRSQSDSAPPGSESDGDSAQMSSSRKSVDSKSKTSSDSRSKEVKKSSCGSHADEREKGSSKRSENHERSSSYSKSDRDSRHTSSRSSRSDKDRRRSRSRSRSRSRGSRTSSSHSRSERSRGDRGSRSERSYYHESDRRSHRSSPRRERRRSRSRTDRTRDSSDSEDDHRKTRTRTSDSSRSSNYLSSHKDSKSSSYSKSEKTSKSVDSPHASELDKRTQSSKSERTSKRLSDSDSQRRCSPDPDSSYRKSSSYHKSETNNRSSSSSNYSHSQTYEKRQKSSSSDSEADHKGKSQPSDRNSGSSENSKNYQNKTRSPESKQSAASRSSVKSTGHDRQSNDIFYSPGKSPSRATATELCSYGEKEKSESQLEHCNQDVKEMTSCTNKALPESLSKTERETKSDFENKNAPDVTIGETLMHVSLDNLSSNNQPHVNSNAAIVNSCSSNERVTCNQDENIFDCSPGPKPLLDTVDIPDIHDVQENTKAEFAELNSGLTVDKQSDPSVKSDSTCLESENQLVQGQQSMDTVKKSGCTRKSRWDIVGQDTSESDNSQRAVCAESKPTVKKMISVKKIEFSKDTSQQDSEMTDNNQQEAVTHSKPVKQTEISEQEVSSDSISVTYKDQSEPSQASTSIDHCDLKLTVCQRTDEPRHTNKTPQIISAATTQSWNGDNYINKSKDSTHKSKESKRASLNQDALGQSEASDSDNSEYDSDCGEAIKQLHSVVVVPKNSSLTMDAENRGASPCRNISEPHSDLNISEFPNKVNLQQREPSGLNDSFGSSVLCQSQSNMIDSTSHSEGSSSVSAAPYITSHIGAHGSATESPHILDNSRQYEEGHKRQDIGSRGDRTYLHYQRNDFSSADKIGEKNEFSMGWDFTQPEQPSSTYQQPDSSHGPQLHTKLTGAFAKLQDHRQNMASCTPQSPNTQTSRKPYLHTHEHFQDPSGEIHPDSLTNDHDDYNGDKLSSLSKTAVECSGPNAPGLSSFVQAHEISSNSRGSAVPDTPREDSFRPHRGRGPPKKRRPEIESDSDNEAEAGPASKREHLGDADVLKETAIKAELRPSLTLQDFQDANKWKELAKSKKMPPYFDLIEENLYLTERKKSKSHRDIKRMQCECPVLPREDRSRGVLACGEDCLNRLLMIECSSRCLNGAYCSNRRFQMKQHADFDVILTEDKGWGLRAAKDLAANTFVLEYCGEVLDHKEFKTRVKEYARNKNIHYYFMSLKNNEIIDATLKGNCSRFMNHSCEPNCETQKWTVNGQLRVGFFTTKAVTAGTELTFDYQFQRYGKEAQKCFCGAPSCRGFLGGENRVSVRAAGGKMKKDRSRKSALTTVDEELEALLENGEGLYDEKQVVSLCRLMVRVETMEQKLICLKLIQDTQNPSCLKQFLDHHGLSMLWIFMMELSEAKGNSANNIKLQLQIMKTLAVLPISTKNMLEESRVLAFIQRWAQTKILPQQAEMDGYSSENTSRAQTPLNTPDGSSAKLGPELDGDASKPAVYRRLKIISENSLDSALSDASKASDGKEEEEEDDDEEEDENSQGELPDGKQLKTEPLGETSDPTKESAEESQKAEATEEKQEDPGMSSSSQHQPQTEEVKDKAAEFDEERKDSEMKEETSEGPVDEPEEPKEPNEEQEGKQNSQEVTEKAELEAEQPTVKTDEPESQSEQMDVTDLPPEPPSETIETQEEAQETEKAPPSNESQPGESTTDAPPISETPEATMPSEVTAAPVDPSVIGTPSQDEEEGVSDVESERSQEPQLSVLDISGMAARLLESWKDLKEVYRIPKKSQVEKESTDRSRDRDAALTPRTASSSRERERERDKERERDRDRDRDYDRDRDRDWDRDRDRDRDRVSEKTPRSSERRRRRSPSPPPSSYERSSRRTEERFDPSNNNKTPRGVGGKERNKLSTEERRKLFEQEVAQREAQKQQQLQQQQQQQQLQTMAYDPTLAYASSPGFITYPPGYPIQTFVDPCNPNAGKVLLPTPAVEPTLSYEQTPPQRLISDLGLPSPSSTSQTTPVSSLPPHITTTNLASGNPQQYAQPTVATQDAGVAVLSVPTQAAPQVQGQQSYTTLWDPTTQQAVTVQTQPAQQYATAPGQAQTQTAIYYQGQPCQTIYSIPTAYPQASTPVIQAYTEPPANYLHSQPVYPGHQQGVVVQQGGTVTTIVTSQTVQQEMIVPNNVIDLPPPSPPKPKTIVLPPNWKVARDPEGKIYYYHIVTRQTQWDPPTWEGSSDNASVDHESEMDLGTPTYDENPSKFSTKTAEADTSSELAKKSKETFRKDISQFIVQCLNPYRKPDCKSGRISNTEDFKHLARKLTHGVMNKELKACKNPEDLECNENVKHKTKEYIKKYMQRFGSVYRPKEDTEVY
ncbi:histone-lysine N-methyltransferase SETD2 isoform X2 [Acanthochromis polyacanthus]|uniref:histone-lysine N-methyltransferase SETD2 isoform X2 n=1 Tax=Acanthochromis polyacanthus TaxID=80966 RepID=UPI0022349BF3|nr:histone-lysine N-methyltransferase SETD2 isoform X2 [Acanthochromis polyacanthus]